jgi:phenylalanyl-tRNA synthetase beta chain
MLEKETAREAQDKKFVMWSQYPFITRDIAVWVPAGTKAEEFIALAKEHGTDLLAREPRIFDQFTKADKTSLAVRLVFQSKDRTLTDADLSGIMENVQKAIQNKGWEVR